MLLNSLLIVVLIICVATDLKSRKIYNKVIFPSLILAVLLNTVFYGLSGLYDSLLGFLLGFGILLIPYLMGGMGAGDVKLLALIGAFTGPVFVLSSAIYMALLGGLVGIGILIYRSGLFSSFRNLFATIRSIRYGIKPKFNIKNGLNAKFPYGVAIAGGAIVTLFVNGAVLL